MNSNGELCNTPFPYILQKKGTGVNILALGDVVGKEAVAYLSGRLRSIIREYKIDFTVINAENSATSNGIDKDSAIKLLDAGADCLTTGNHVFKVSSFYDYLENSHTVIRPLNYPKRCPGKGYTVLDCGFERVLVIMSQAGPDLTLPTARSMPSTAYWRRRKATTHFRLLTSMPKRHQKKPR